MEMSVFRVSEYRVFTVCVERSRKNVTEPSEYTAIFNIAESYPGQSKRDKKLDQQFFDKFA